MSFQLKWVPDLVAESRFRDMMGDAKLKLTRERVHLSEINFKWSKLHQSRGNAWIMDDTVVKYAMDMINGNAFPSPFLLRLTKEHPPWGVISGNQRCYTIKSLVEWRDLSVEDAWIEAYTINADEVDEMGLDIFKFSSNRILGVAQNEEDVLTPCLEMLAKWNGAITVAEVARQFSIKEEVINTELRRRQTRELLRKGNVNADLLGITVVSTLERLTYSHPLMIKTAQMVLEFGLSAKRAEELTSEIKHAHSEEEAMKVLLRWRADLMQEKKPQALPKLKRKKRSLFVERLNHFSNFMFHKFKGGAFKSLGDLGITSKNDQFELYVKWKTVRDHTDKLFHEVQVQYEKAQQATKTAKAVAGKAK